MTTLNNPKPPLRAVPMSLFPTMGSLDEVMEMAQAKLTTVDRNELHAIFMSYHNTLLAQIKVN